MPHPRKHMKLTGDTHPPDVEDDLGVRDDASAAAAPAAPASEGAGGAPQTRSASRTIVVAMPARQYVDTARDQVRARPLATAAAAFFAGFVLAVVTRSR